MQQALQSEPEFRKLAEQVRLRYPPVHTARIAFTIPEKDLFPEGLAVDWDKHVFYMGSMHRKKIIRITEVGEVPDFVEPDLYNLMPVGGVKVDPADHSVWAATDPGEADRSELVHFDAHGKLLERFPAPGPGPHDLNDLVLRHESEIYLSDTFAHRAYRFDRKSHSFTPLTFPRPLFYPNGITVSGDGSSLYVADTLGVIRVDLRNNVAHEVDPGKANTLAGIDGLYWYKGDLLAVQYGTGSYRVVRFHLSPDGLGVTSSEILEYRTPLVSFPTTDAIAGENFYFIANTGIANLRDDKIVDPGKLEPIRVAVVPL
jgi:sugar lactone lactonase YvrE